MAVRPPMLMAGDTFGIVTLGSPLAASTINERINYIRGLGFKVVVGKYAFSYNGYIAASAQNRASDLMSMFENPAVKVILPSRGGVGVSDVLPYLDYKYINLHPKIITGYSDITVLLNALYQFSNIITFQSLLLIDFKASTPAYNFNQFYAATSTTVSPRQIQNPPGIPLISRVKGIAEGPIVGGNLTSLLGTLGTPYEINTKGKILLLEETNEPVNTVYRYIRHLKLAGKFRDCVGIVVGECTGCETAYGKTFEDLINEELVPIGKPLITNLRTAHGLYKAAVPIGANVRLNSYNNTLTILEPTVSR